MVVTPLVELYNPNDEDSKRMLLESFSLFKCAQRSDDVEDFLKSKCIQFEERDLARTFIVFDEIAFDILGYFALAIKSIDLKDESKTTKKRIASDVNAAHSAVFLIGQLAKSDKCGTRLAKNQLLKEAIKHIQRARAEVAGRIVYIDCKNDEKLIKYYSDAGFNLLRTREDGYAQMFMRIE
jgi:hypothetical protein